MSDPYAVYEEVGISFDETFESNSPGTVTFVKGREGWVIKLTKRPCGGHDFDQFKLVKHGGEIVYAFCRVSSCGTQHGNALISEDPSLAIPTCVLPGETGTRGFIHGYLIGSRLLNLMEDRFSTSNKTLMQGKSIEIRAEDETSAILYVDGEPLGYIHTLFEVDNGRIDYGMFEKHGGGLIERRTGYVALVTQQKPDQIIYTDRSGIALGYANFAFNRQLWPNEKSAVEIMNENK